MRQMKIGWLIPTVGMFGAVREMIEVSNVLVARGHQVTIYSPDGGPCVWLPCHANYAPLEKSLTAGLDALIGIIDWKPELYKVLANSDAKLKATCLLGFEPTDELARILRHEQPAVTKDLRVMREALEETLVLADSSWQLAWVKEHVGSLPVLGVPFGGINLEMFKPLPEKPQRERPLIIASGDPRPRKGSDTVAAAIELLRHNKKVAFDYDTYWGKRYTQAQLVKFYQEADLFLDGHRRGGWCNPVAEAIACGTAVVCTDIGAVRDFAVSGETALVVPLDNAEALAQAAAKLLQDAELRRKLVLNGLHQIQAFDYRVVVPKLEACLASYL